MKKEELFEAIGKINSETVEKNAPYKSNGNKMLKMSLRNMKKWTALAASLAVIAGAGFFAYHQMRGANEIANPSETVDIVDSSQNNVVDVLEENGNGIQTDEIAENSNTDTMYEDSMVDTLKDYNTVDDLLNDAYALVKVKVLQAESANVRSYIYTTYNVEIMDVLYGDITENRICVNLPGGIIEGEEAQKMLSEVTEGKDAGDLPNVGNVVSNGNTDRLLEVGNEAYLFLIPESDTTYAVVGEYRGVILLENGNVLFDSNIVGFQDEIAGYELSNGGMIESDFVEAMKKIIMNKN